MSGRRRQERIRSKGRIARLERVDGGKQPRKFRKEYRKDEVRRRKTEQHAEELQKLLRTAIGKSPQQPQHDPARKQRKQEPLPGKARKKRLRRRAPISDPTAREKCAGDGKRAKPEQRILSLPIPPRPDTRERIERQKYQKCIQRERKGKTKTPRAGKHAEPLSCRAAGKSRERKGCALDEPQGERQRQADGALDQQKRFHLTAFHTAHLQNYCFSIIPS